jgi:hypothetical protein
MQLVLVYPNATYRIAISKFVLFCTYFSVIVGDYDSHGISTLYFNPFKLLIVVILGYGSSLPLNVRLMTGQRRS